jgi:hypothetical protein
VLSCFLAQRASPWLREDSGVRGVADPGGGGGGGSSSGGRPLNKNKVPYPEVKVKGYGEVKFPKGKLIKTDPQPLRDAFTKKLKIGFRTWWHKKYGWYPNPDIYDLHHIHPLAWGGTNDFSNLVPLNRFTQHKLLTGCWASFK